MIQALREKVCGTAPVHSRPLVGADGGPRRGRERWWYDVSYATSLSPDEALDRFERFDVQVRPDGSFSYGRAVQLVGWIEASTDDTTGLRSAALAAPLAVVFAAIALAIADDLARTVARLQRSPDLLEAVIETVHGSVDRSR